MSDSKDTKISFEEVVSMFPEGDIPMDVYAIVMDYDADTARDKIKALASELKRQKHLSGVSWAVHLIRQAFGVEPHCANEIAAAIVARPAGAHSYTSNGMTLDFIVDDSGNVSFTTAARAEA